MAEFDFANSAPASSFGHAAFCLAAKSDDPGLPRRMDLDPELAEVGLIEIEARATSHTSGCCDGPLSENDRAMTGRAPAGFVKLAATRRRRLLGAGILSRSAREMIGACTLAMARRLKVSALAAMNVPKLFVHSLFFGKSR